MTATIQAENLTKFYGQHRGIVEVDLEVSEGEAFGFLGPNGAGKTTMIRTLLNHIRPTSGKASIFGGLCASGWNTTAVMMRMWVDNYLSPEASLGSPGIDELRWLKPVYPGDWLRCRLTVIDATPSRSRSFMGSVRQRAEVINQKDEVVLSLIGTSFFRRRPA